AAPATARRRATTPRTRAPRPAKATVAPAAEPPTNGEAPAAKRAKRAAPAKRATAKATAAAKPAAPRPRRPARKKPTAEA
ncbi:MAG TPA: hypothetical protein VL049_20140, partial [Candidatus Dormibacteraeota bacterium]|nr:hypothetical protein [Candidatus Dormibacteraeota bacterium]